MITKSQLFQCHTILI